MFSANTKKKQNSYLTNFVKLTITQKKTWFKKNDITIFFFIYLMSDLLDCESPVKWKINSLKLTKNKILGTKYNLGKLYRFELQCIERI